MAESNFGLTSSLLQQAEMKQVERVLPTTSFQHFVKMLQTIYSKPKAEIKKRLHSS
jgi:hypothetical protein